MQYCSLVHGWYSSFVWLTNDELSIHAGRGQHLGALQDAKSTCSEEQADQERPALKEKLMELTATTSKSPYFFDKKKYGDLDKVLDDKDSLNEMVKRIEANGLKLQKRANGKLEELQLELVCRHASSCDCLFLAFFWLTASRHLSMLPRGLVESQSLNGAAAPPCAKTNAAVGCLYFLQHPESCVHLFCSSAFCAS